MELYQYDLVLGRSRQQQHQVEEEQQQGDTPPPVQQQQQPCSLEQADSQQDQRKPQAEGQADIQEDKAKQQSQQQAEQAEQAEQKEQPSEVPLRSFFVPGQLLDPSLPQQPYAPPMDWAHQLTLQLAAAQHDMFLCGLLRGSGAGPGSDSRGQQERAAAAAAAEGAAEANGAAGGEESGKAGVCEVGSGGRPGPVLEGSGTAAAGGEYAQHIMDLARRQQAEYVDTLRKEVGSGS